MGITSRVVGAPKTGRSLRASAANSTGDARREYSQTLLRKFIRSPQGRSVATTTDSRRQKVGCPDTTAPPTSGSALSCRPLRQVAPHVPQFRSTARETQALPYAALRRPGKGTCW